MRKRIFQTFFAIFLIISALGFYCIFDFTGGTSNEPMFVPDPVNVLVMIKDRHSGLTDSMMVIHYDPIKPAVSMLSIPRDTAVSIDGSTHKINSVYSREDTELAGGKLACKYVSDLTGVKVNKFIVADLDIVRDVVDSLGGVEYRVPIRMKYRDKSQGLVINLKRGKQHLNGDQVEQLLRYRHPNANAKKPKNYEKYYDGSDLKRTNVQMKFIKTFVQQKASVLSLGKVTQVLDSIYKNVITNFSRDEILKTMSRLTSLGDAKFNTYRLYGTGYSYYEYDGNFLNTKNNKLYDGDEIIKEKFTIRKDGSTPSPVQ